MDTESIKECEIIRRHPEVTEILPYGTMADDINTVRLHSSLGYGVPAPEAIQRALIASAAPHLSKPVSVGTGPTLT
jgi:hypothetical protein